MKKYLLAIGMLCIIVSLLWPFAYLANHPELLPTLPAKETAQSEAHFITGNQAEMEIEAKETSMPVFTGNLQSQPSMVVTVTTSTLEKRSWAGGGENMGYWQEGDVITVSWLCVNDAGDVWIAFGGGWSAARYQGREFVSPLPVVTEVCDE